MVKKQNRILIALLLMCMVLSAIPSYAQKQLMCR